MTTTLHGALTTLRTAEPADAERLAAILSSPEVSRWWPRYDRHRVREVLIEDRDTVVFVIEYAGQVVGSIQYVEEPARDYRHASVDVFLDPEEHGKGLGTDAVKTLVRHLVYDRGHHRVAIHPAADNEKAIKTFTRVGFRPVGVMRKYERNADGDWQDCLLMDILEPDLG